MSQRKVPVPETESAAMRRSRLSRNSSSACLPLVMSTQAPIM